MARHPSLDAIAERYGAIDAQIRKGALDLPRALSAYAYVTKQGALGVSNLSSAAPDQADTDSGSIPFVVSTYAPDRDGDIVVPMGCQLDNYAKNPVVFFGHQEFPIPIARCMAPNGRL